VSNSAPELSRRENNLDAIRVVAAVAVIVGHAFVLTNSGFQPRLLGIDLQTLGVDVFFIISGYLITRSWARRPHFASYLSARALRIFPALILVTLLSVGILGPALTSGGLGAYVRDPRTWEFLKNILLQPTWFLPGVFDSNPYQGVVNGSLWSLPVEFACYLIVPILMLLPGRWKIPAVVLFGLVSAICVFALSAPVFLYGFVLQQAVEPWVFFAGGMLCALVLDRTSFRVAPALVIVAALFAIGLLVPQASRIAAWITLPYALLSLGLASTPIVRRVSRYGDFSYGLYIYAFPVQQTFVAIFGVVLLPVNIVAVITISAAFAAASWYLVESPALRLKVRLERRLSSVNLRGLDTNLSHAHGIVGEDGR